MTQAELIKEAVNKARKDWATFTLDQQRDLYKLFDDAANYLSARISRYSVEGKIPPIRLKTLIGEVQAEMQSLRAKLRRAIQKGQNNSIDFGIKTGIIGSDVALSPRFKVGIGTSFINKSGNVVRHDAKEQKYADSAWAALNLKAAEALIKTTFGGITLSERVWDITWNVERQIRNQINLAVLIGMDAGRLSRNIRGYLGMPRTFRGLAFREFHPGVGVYRSAYKNALRLSATEMNRAYNEGMIVYAKEKDWVTGFIWRTGSGNPCDECEDNEGELFSKDDPPFLPVHPNCLCYLELEYEETALI